jgi:hypothetical protein
VNGTSFSSPTTAGLVALYLELNPGADPADVLLDFERGARPVEDESQDHRDGAGLADFGTTVGIRHHQSEVNFEDYVEQLFHEEFGPDSVHRQYFFEGTDARADFIVTTSDGLPDLGVELENDAASVRAGSGQCVSYASEWNLETGHVTIPMLVVPDGHIDAPERRVAENAGIVVREVPIPTDVNTRGV